jgi:multiple sugar transport system permease protein
MSVAELQELEEVKLLVTKGTATGVLTYTEVATALAEVDLDESDIDIGVVEGIVWTGIWDSNSGLLNSVLSSLHLISDYHVFLGNNRLLTIFAIELVQVWQITPLSALLILAALQNVPGDLFEAAQLDGCGPWASFRRVTLPLIRPGITIAMVQALIQTLNVFDQPYVLNGSASTGTSVTMQTYFISFQNLDFGEGYALSLVLTITTLVISLGIVKLVYRPVEF